MRIVSIPGSGTRSLARHLGVGGFEHVTPTTSLTGGDIAIPFRDPLAVMLTNEAHKRELPTRQDWELLLSICPRATVYSVETLPEKEGTNRPHYPRKELYRHQMWGKLRDLIEVVDFPALVDFTNSLGIETKWSRNG